MNNNLIKVLTQCIKTAREGEVCVNVFDLMYETSLPYPELKVILDKLVEQKELAVIDIKTYKFTGDINRNLEELKRQTNPPRVVESQAYDEFDPFTAERRAYLEQRRRELIRRMQEMEEKESEDLSTESEQEDTETDEEELRYKAVKLCIEKHAASVSLFQRTFPIGYNRACKLIDWMEEQGYVSASEGAKPRKVLITLNEFNKIFNEPPCAEESDGDVDIDEKFTEYERYIRERLSAIEDESGGSEDGEPDKIDAIDFIKTLIIEKRWTYPSDKIPERSCWDDEDGFMQVIGERLILLINSNKKMGRLGAIKKAARCLDDARKTKNQKMAEVYERIIFELQNMSNYYYIKIRERIL